MVVVALAALLHASRQNTYPLEDSFDKVTAGLKGIDKVLPQTTNINIDPAGIPAEILFFAGYRLAPRCSETVKEHPADTVLHISAANAPEPAFTAVQKVIWSAKDDMYRYYLTSTK
jgi:hypothetical protein